MKYTARPGDCVLKIAAKFGVPWKRVWDHPNNRELVEKRESPNIIMSGDEVFIPEKELREEQGATGQRHRFRKKSDLIELRLKIQEFGEPRADEPYYVMVGSRRYDGEAKTTDKEGTIICKIPATADEAIVMLGEDPPDEYEVKLGQIDPMDTPEGIHSRLENLGHYDGGIDTPFDQETMDALRGLLAEMGEPADDTNDLTGQENLDKLKEGYGS